MGWRNAGAATLHVSSDAFGGSRSDHRIIAQGTRRRARQLHLEASQQRVESAVAGYCEGSSGQKGQYAKCECNRPSFMHQAQGL